MAATDSNYRSAATDVTALLKQSDFSQVVQKARAMKLSLREDSKVMEHPVEDGTTITDHRVILPVEGDLSVIIAGSDYRSTYQSLRALFLSGELLILQTQVASHQNMLIVSMPREESPDMQGAIPIALRVKEVKTVKASYGTLPPRAVANKADASTVKKGDTSTTTQDSTKPGSAAYASRQALRSSIGGK